MTIQLRVFDRAVLLLLVSLVACIEDPVEPVQPDAMPPRPDANQGLVYAVDGLYDLVWSGDVRYALCARGELLDDTRQLRLLGDDQACELLPATIDGACRCFPDELDPDGHRWCLCPAFGHLHGELEGHGTVDAYPTP